MKAYLIAWAALFTLTLATWYLLGVLEIGVVDGTGIAPVWLRALHGIELIVLWPLGRFALALDPAIGYLRLGSFLAFAVVVALNSALWTLGVWLVRTGITVLRRREHGRRDA